MTSAAPSGWRVGWGGGGATLSPTPPNQLTEVSALFCHGKVWKRIQFLHLFLSYDSCWTSRIKCSYPFSLTQEFSATMFPCFFPWPLTTAFPPPFDHLSSFLSHFFTVVFSSMTSLQKEEFFDLVATAQGRRLEDQRAQLGRSSPPKTKTRSVRGSIRQLSLSVKKPAPVPAPKDDLYDMILTTQVSNELVCLDVFVVSWGVFCFVSEKKS